MNLYIKAIGFEQVDSDFEELDDTRRYSGQFGEGACYKE